MGLSWPRLLPEQGLILKNGTHFKNVPSVKQAQEGRPFLKFQTKERSPYEVRIVRPSSVNAYLGHPEAKAW